MSARRIATALAVLAPALLLVDTVRQSLEAGMAWQMAALPATTASGCALGMLIEGHAPQGALRGSDGGLLGLTAASCMLAFWMLPVALDLSLLSNALAVAKYLGLWIAGLLLATSLRRASPELLAFFGGNAALMFATAGLLYIDAEARLCLGYRYDEQAAAGGVLIALAVAIGLATLHRLTDPQT